MITLTARGTLGSESITCKVQTGRALIEAGLHPAMGGDGLSLCSGDMLLEALVACAGVTLKAVATALDLPLRGGTVSAEGELDVRGTLGVDREAPVGSAQFGSTSTSTARPAPTKSRRCSGSPSAIASSSRRSASIHIWPLVTLLRADELAAIDLLSRREYAFAKKGERA